MKKYIILFVSMMAAWTMQAQQIDAITMDMDVHCIDSTYDIIVTVYFSGDVYAVRVEGDQVVNPQTKTTASPYTVTIKNCQAQEGSAHSVTAKLYSNTYSVLAELSYAYEAPAITCEEYHELGDTCTSASLTLSTDEEGDVYEWSTGERNVTSITVQPALGDQTYWVKVYGTTLQAAANLMNNGDFETVPASGQAPVGFTSDYYYVGFNLSAYYDQPGHRDNNLFAIQANAHTFYHTFQNVTAHGGNYFALFDAGNSGYAWKAATADNPDLKIQKDSIYLFSYWAANPNNASESSNPAQLQFEIQFRNTNGNMVKQQLGTTYTLPTDNEWHQQMVSWKAPVSSDEVVIAVYDANNNQRGVVGNDFCLDDIMFQQAAITNMVLAKQEFFNVTGIDCDTVPTPPTPPADCDTLIYAKWNDFLFVNNGAPFVKDGHAYDGGDGQFVAYQWYRNDELVEGATDQYLRVEDIRSTDTFFVVVTKKDGTEQVSCEVKFSDLTARHGGALDQYPRPQEVARRYHFVGSHFRIIEIFYEDGSTQSQKEVY